uniref:Carboxypeptidase regulatory-like domain-containing protein n=1 Tax=Schlesneria paludicola TaxID=360056 RepID=A0A7C2JYU1_9PLAN
MTVKRLGPRASAGLLLLTALSGCGADGPERHAVDGAVQFNGRPMARGTIRFIPTAGTKGPAAVGTIADGFYEIPRDQGPVAGPHRVEIEGPIALPFEIDDEQAFAKAFQTLKGKPLPPQPVPAPFNRQSMLTADVLAGGQTKFDFDLSTRPEPPPQLTPHRVQSHLLHKE